MTSLMDAGQMNKRIQSRRTMTFKDKTKDWMSHWEALGRLIERLWFLRRWVIQETDFALQKSFFCGNWRVCWVAFDELVYFYHNEHCDGEIDHPHGACALIISLRWASKKVRHGEEHFLTLEFLAARFHMSFCTDTRDVVYSPVSMPVDIDPKNWLLNYLIDNNEPMVSKKAFEHIVHKRQ